MTTNSDGRSRTASKGTSLNRPFRFGSKAGRSDELARHRTSLRADIFSHGIDEHITTSLDFRTRCIYQMLAHLTKNQKVRKRERWISAQSKSPSMNYEYSIFFNPYYAVYSISRKKIVICRFEQISWCLIIMRILFISQMAERLNCG
jgi:hypothetical protein